MEGVGALEGAEKQTGSAGVAGCVGKEEGGVGLAGVEEGVLNEGRGKRRNEDSEGVTGRHTEMMEEDEAGVSTGKGDVLATMQVSAGGDGGQAGGPAGGMERSSVGPRSSAGQLGSSTQGQSRSRGCASSWVDLRLVQVRFCCVCVCIGVYMPVRVYVY